MPEPKPDGGATPLDNLVERIRQLESDVRKLGEMRQGSGFNRGLTADMPAPYDGQMLVDADTETPYYYSNGAWRPFGGGGISWVQTYGDSQSGSSPNFNHNSEVYIGAATGGEPVRTNDPATFDYDVGTGAGSLRALRSGYYQWWVEADLYYADAADLPADILVWVVQPGTTYVDTARINTTGKMIRPTALVPTDQPTFNRSMQHPVVYGERPIDAAETPFAIVPYCWSSNGAGTWFLFLRFTFVRLGDLTSETVTVIA